MTNRIYGVAITWTDFQEIGVEQWQLPDGAVDEVRDFLSARYGPPGLEQLMPAAVSDSLMADGRVLEIHHE